MSKIGTKYPPEKLEYWRQYRRDNAEKCKNQRRQWREQNRDRIRLCARRSYYCMRVMMMPPVFKPSFPI